MKLKELKIGPFNYAIKYVKNLYGDNPDGTSVMLAGAVNSTDLVIQIWKGNNEQHERAVLIHEALHAISDQAGYDISENTIEMFANGITGLLLENPEFLDIFRTATPIMPPQANTMGITSTGGKV